MLLLLSTVCAAGSPVVDKVNTYRKLHGSPDVTDTESLMKIARTRANAMQEMSHDLQGENLAIFSVMKGLNDTDYIKRAVDMWYSEEKTYNYSKPGYSDSTGHFTQLVWRETCRIGFAAAVDKQNKWVYVIMLHSPPGNMQNRFNSNVFKQNTTVQGKCNPMHSLPPSPSPPMHSHPPSPSPPLPLPPSSCTILRPVMSFVLGLLLLTLLI